QRAFFDTFKTAVFYTPGNNEWVDCWKENRGSADPTEILKLMREVFYKEPKSRGAAPLSLVRQADADRDFAEFAENARWRFGDATFATRNLAGTYNNQELRVPRYWQEFVRREQANLAWVKATFVAARSAGHRAVVLAFHSNPFDEKLRYDGGPLEPLLRAVIRENDALSGQGLDVAGPHPRVPGA